MDKGDWKACSLWGCKRAGHDLVAKPKQTIMGTCRFSLLCSILSVKYKAGSSELSKNNRNSLNIIL